MIKKRVVIIRLSNKYLNIILTQLLNGAFIILIKILVIILHFILI